MHQEPRVQWVRSDPQDQTDNKVNRGHREGQVKLDSLDDLEKVEFVDGQAASVQQVPLVHQEMLDLADLLDQQALVAQTVSCSVSGRR